MNRFKYMAKLNRLTAKKLAEKTGYSVSYIYCLYQGKLELHDRQAEIFAPILGVSKEYLLNKTDNRKGELA